jgi:hypothetical protein
MHEVASCGKAQMRKKALEENCSYQHKKKTKNRKID